MLRVFIIWLGTYGIINVDIESTSLLNSRIFPIFNIYYFFFLLKEFTRFLISLKTHGTQGSDVNIGDLLHDVFSLIHREISIKYEGKLLFLGGPDSLARDLLIQIEIVCVLISVYFEFQFIAELLS